MKSYSFRSDLVDISYFASEHITSRHLKNIASSLLRNISYRQFKIFVLPMIYFQHLYDYVVDRSFVAHASINCHSRLVVQINSPPRINLSKCTSIYKLINIILFYIFYFFLFLSFVCEKSVSLYDRPCSNLKINILLRIYKKVARMRWNWELFSRSTFLWSLYTTWHIPLCDPGSGFVDMNRAWTMREKDIRRSDLVDTSSLFKYDASSSFRPLLLTSFLCSGSGRTALHRLKNWN